MKGVNVNQLKIAAIAYLVGITGTLSYNLGIHLNSCLKMAQIALLAQVYVPCHYHYT